MAKKKSAAGKKKNKKQASPQSKLGLRSMATSLMGALETDAGRAALAAALTAAADALLRHRPAAAVAQAGAGAASSVGGLATAALDVVGDVARQVLPAGLTGADEPSTPDSNPGQFKPRPPGDFEAKGRRRDKH